MAIAASSVTPTNSLEDFRIEFNNLVSDVTGITSTNTFSETIVFEGATADGYETTLTVTDPTADRTVTIPNATGTVLLSSAANPTSSDGAALGTSALEWSDLYLADGGIIYFGDDQDVTLTHVADTGLRLADSDKLQFGTSGDLEIYHDGSNSYIVDGGTGNLKIYTNQLEIIGTAETLATFVDDGAVTLYYNNTAALATASAAVNVTGDLTATLTIQPAGDTAADDNAAIGYTSAEGLILTGQGSTNDVTIKNDADADVITIATGGTAVDVVGALTAATVTSDAGVSGTTGTFSSDVTGLTINATGDTATSDNAAMGYTSAEGLILTGQGSTNDVTIKNDADGDVISIPTGTTNVTIAGDLTISGDDLFMGTNTDAYILVADGTNYNPVAVSGDVTISNAGAITIASTAVEGSMLNNNVISGQTALTTTVATTDELMISDAGTLKRVDVSLITDLATGDATALAIALG